jgi:Rrf2 family protein
MILTKTTEYAVRVLTYMASQNNKTLFSAKYLYEQLNIPYKYLTRLMTDLSKHGCIESIKGRNGGFKLIKQLSDITLANIIESVEGMNTFNSCILGFHECSSENPCAMHFIWEKNKVEFIKALENTSLYDLSHMNIKRF